MALCYPDREVIPTVLEPGDPSAGDELLYDLPDFETARVAAGWTDHATWAEADLRFFDRYRDAVAGRCPLDDPALTAAAHVLQIDGTITHDRRPLPLTEVAIPDEALVDIVEDWVPDALHLAERITGSEDPPDVPVIAALAFVGINRMGRRALDFWTDDEGGPLARAAHTLDRSPANLYLDGRSMLPVAPRQVPGSGLEGSNFPYPPFDPASAPPGPAVARAYITPGGWRWSCVVRLPAVPDVGTLLRRLTLELWRSRRHERRTTFEDLLRRRPEVLYRAANEGARRALLGHPSASGCPPVPVDLTPLAGAGRAPLS